MRVNKILFSPIIFQQFSHKLEMCSSIVFIFTNVPFDEMCQIVYVGKTDFVQYSNNSTVHTQLAIDSAIKYTAKNERMRTEFVHNFICAIGHCRQFEVKKS